MSLISTLTLENMKALHDEISEKAKTCNSLESAAQAYMSSLYDNLSESIVLARLFATIHFKDLQEEVKSYVKRIVESAGVKDKLKETTLVLTLLGSRGVNNIWNNRSNSRDHKGIPLISKEFVETIPMPYQMLKQLGIGLDWIENVDAGLNLKTAGRINGIFYVRDAKTEVDSKKRKVIASQEFVDEWNIKSVFGVAGSYLGSSTFFTTVVFARETLDREIIDRFILQANKFKTATMGIVHKKIFFKNDLNME